MLPICSSELVDLIFEHAPAISLSASRNPGLAVRALRHPSLGDLPDWHRIGPRFTARLQLYGSLLIDALGHV